MTVLKPRVRKLSKVMTPDNRDNPDNPDNPIVSHDIHTYDNPDNPHLSLTSR